MLKREIMEKCETKRKFLTKEELVKKIISVENSCSEKEKAIDELLDVLSFLIALRDGHEHRFNIGMVIYKMYKSLELINDIK